MSTALSALPSVQWSLGPSSLVVVDGNFNSFVRTVCASRLSVVKCLVLCWCKIPLFELCFLCLGFDFGVDSSRQPTAYSFFFFFFKTAAFLFFFFFGFNIFR